MKNHNENDEMVLLSSYNWLASIFNDFFLLLFLILQDEAKRTKNCNGRWVSKGKKKIKIGIVELSFWFVRIFFCSSVAGTRVQCLPSVTIIKIGRQVPLNFLNYIASSPTKIKLNWLRSITTDFRRKSQEKIEEKKLNNE